MFVNTKPIALNCESHNSLSGLTTDIESHLFPLLLKQDLNAATVEVSAEPRPVRTSIVGNRLGSLVLRNSFRHSIDQANAVVWRGRRSFSKREPSARYIWIVYCFGNIPWKKGTCPKMLERIPPAGCFQVIGMFVIVKQSNSLWTLFVTDVRRAIWSIIRADNSAFATRRTGYKPRDKVLNPYQWYSRQSCGKASLSNVLTV